LLGCGDEDCLGRNVFEMFAGHKARPSTAELQASTERAVTVELEQLHTSPAVYLRGRLTRIFDPAGKLTNLAFVFRDVSDERRAEKLQTDFLSLVSHKLKTPLTILSGYMRLIAAGKYGPVPTEMGEAFDLVNSSVEDLKLLIDRLLQYAGLSAEELRHEAVVVDLATVVDRSIARVRSRHGEGHVECETDLPADLPRLRADVEHLALVLDNLLDNAVKFTPAEPVRVRVVGRADQADRVEVTVRDFGPGIPLKHQAAIFSDFQQVDDAFTGNVRGLGLGLPTAKRLVENWGGTIRVDSRPGEGAAFIFTVPTARGAEAADRAAPRLQGGPPGHMETA
jgi:signal transduction histidine kinase